MRSMASSAASKGIVAIVGVGPKLGRSVARKFAHEGHTVAILARDLGLSVCLSLSLSITRNLGQSLRNLQILTKSFYNSPRICPFFLLRGKRGSVAVGSHNFIFYRFFFLQIKLLAKHLVAFDG